MGEEEKKKMGENKPEETVKKPAVEEKGKKEEEKPTEVNEEKKPEDSKEAKEQSLPAPEIVLKVYMHCEGCARKVRRCLRGFEGVEDVVTDCKTHKVVVKGEKADPLKVLERVQRKSHRKVELLSPIPKPPEEPKPEEKEKPKEPEVKKEEPQVVTVVLRVHMHCEACAQGIKKRILRMKGVESVEPDLKASQVSVMGSFEPQNLVEYVYKRTGKQAVIVKQEPEKKEKEEAAKETKEEKATEEGKKETKSEEEESKETKEANGENMAAEEIKVVELKKNEYNYYPQRYAMEMYAYPPQIFSDENPNACSVM